jgi:hypothetical protein
VLVSVLPDRDEPAPYQPVSYRGRVLRADITPAASVGRRAVLLGATALAVAACTGEPAGAPRPSTSPPTRDQRLRREIAAAEADLVALYAATRAAHPELAEALGLVEDRHRHHSAAIGSSGPVAPAMRPTTETPDGASVTASPSPTPAVSIPPVAADPDAALSALRIAEETAAEARLRDCLRCEDPVLAELTAAIAAGEAANAVLLPVAP